MWQFLGAVCSLCTMNQKLKFALGRVENIGGNGENAAEQHFLLFPKCFKKAPYTGSLLCGKQLNGPLATIIGLSKVERVCRQQFQMWQKWRKAVQYNEQKNLEEKRKIACYKQFLLFCHCFHKSVHVRNFNRGVWKNVPYAANKQGFTMVCISCI